MGPGPAGLPLWPRSETWFAAAVSGGGWPWGTRLVSKSPAQENDLRA